MHVVGVRLELEHGVRVAWVRACLPEKRTGVPSVVVESGRRRGWMASGLTMVGCIPVKLAQVAAGGGAWRVPEWVDARPPAR